MVIVFPTREKPAQEFPGPTTIVSPSEAASIAD
jgi:hypothetical protein